MCRFCVNTHRHKQTHNYQIRLCHLFCLVWIYLFSLLRIVLWNYFYYYYYQHLFWKFIYSSGTFYNSNFSDINLGLESTSGFIGNVPEFTIIIFFVGIPPCVPTFSISVITDLPSNIIPNI